MLAAVLAMLGWDGGAQGGTRLAITIDDLPSHGPLPGGTRRIEAAQGVLGALAAEKVPVTGFVNGAGVDPQGDGAEVIARWRAAGHPIGNHGWSHRDLDQVGAAAFIADLVRNEAVLAAASPQSEWRWLRYPFLHEGKDPVARAAVRRWLADHHYRIAPVTMSFSDYLWTAPYARCMYAGDTRSIRWMEGRFLAAARADAQLATRRKGQAAEVLLIHLGAFDARMMPRLLALYRRLGFTFVALDEAARDPALAAGVDPNGPGASFPLAPVDPKTVARLDRICR